MMICFYPIKGFLLTQISIGSGLINECNLKEKMSKKNIVLSAINFFEGGPLSILKDCLTFLNTSTYLHQYNFIALVHKKSLFDESEYAHITFIEFPKSRTSYIYRLYYEYVYF